MHRLKLSTPGGETEIVVGENLTGQLGRIGKSTALLVDSKVLDHHGHLLEDFPAIPIPSGEENKNLQTVERLCRELVRLEVDRSWFLVGIGGGLATDVAGFTASAYLRGIPFGFISTTLLGQVDASIGGKNGVNLDRYKNMVGVFRQPSFVWCDLSLLSTLSRREYVSGLAEVIKYGAIRDPSILGYLEDRMDLLLDLDPSALEWVVTASAGIKAEVVGKDELESGLRMVLNFGHTLGHAIERELKCLHGEAISAGMVLEARMSHLRGMLSSGEVDRICRLVERAGLPAKMDLDPAAIMENIRKDKKRSGDHIYVVLLEGLGNARAEPFHLDELKQMCHDLC